MIQNIKCDKCGKEEEGTLLYLLQKGWNFQSVSKCVAICEECDEENKNQEK